MTIQKIRFLREKKKLRHEDMADRLEISTSAYSRLENGETKIDVERLKKIADILEVPVEELLSTEGMVFNVSSKTGAQGYVHQNIPQEFVRELMDRLDAKHEAHVKNLEAMNQRLMDLLEKKL